MLPLPGPSGPASLKTCQRACFPGAAAPCQGGEHPQAQSSQVRERPALLPSGSAGFGRQLKNCTPSVSLRSTLQADKSSFRLISPPMKFPPQAVIGGSSLDPHLRMLLAAASKLVFRSCLRKRDIRLGDMCFRARRLKAAEPVRKAHREKVRECPRRKLVFPWGIPLPFLVPGSLKLFTAPA